MDLVFQIGATSLNLKENPTILVFGETGSGKSTLLKNIWKQLANKYRDEIKFVLIDLKQVEFENLIPDKNVITICRTPEEADKALDEVLFNHHSFPIVVIWDVFEDYFYLHNQALGKFKKLLSKGPKKGIYTIACSSRVANGEEYVDLFSLVLLGKSMETDYGFLTEKMRVAIKNARFDPYLRVEPYNLKPGEFLMIRDDKITLVQNQQIDYSKWIEDIKLIPKDEWKVILDFENFIDEFHMSRFGNVVDVTSRLPHPKERIAGALKIALDTVKDNQLKNYLIVLGGTLDTMTIPKLFKTLKENWR